MEERRKTTLTDGDIKAIALAICKIQATLPCECPVDLEDLREAVKFYKNVNSFFDGSKRTVWNTLLTLAVVGVVGLVSLGIWHKGAGQ